MKISHLCPVLTEIDHIQKQEVMNKSRKFFSLIFLFISLLPLGAQQDPPRLVVVLTVDQMRAEYLVRYRDKYVENGFRRMVENGFNFRNAHFPYVPTETGPGHAAIHTGALPSVSGIIGNGWYDRKAEKSVNVVSGKEKYTTVGASDTFGVGKAGPDFMLVTTIADELKKASQFRSKTISVSIKDRSAILSGGYTSDGSYWYDGLTGHFVTSTYYTESLPGWVADFNENGLVDSLSRKTWELSLPAEAYTESRSDDNTFEYKLRGKKAPVFPYDLGAMNEGFDSYFLLPYSPFSNDLLAAFAKKAILEEKLGKDEITDMLAISFSATDISGHAFGPYSVEIEDMYLKLDQTIAGLMDFLDAEVGEGEYLIVLTADHGATAAPKFLRSKKLPGGVSNMDALNFMSNLHVREVLGIDTAVLYVSKDAIYLDRSKISDRDTYKRVSEELKAFLEANETILSAYTREDLEQFGGNSPDHLKLLQNCFFPSRSGDVFYISRPGWLGLSPRIATSHGSPFSYDTHVPVVFYGKNIPSGSTVRKVKVTQIAPSLSFLCDVMLPSGSTGEVLLELFH